eukprot:15451085-Alexandrium_andersonii.AAC.1
MREGHSHLLPKIRQLYGQRCASACDDLRQRTAGRREALQGPLVRSRDFAGLGARERRASPQKART